MKILIFILLILTTPVKASEDTVSLIKVSDGDTIKVLLNGEKENIRLLDIDCYETSKNKSPKNKKREDGFLRPLCSI